MPFPFIPLERKNDVAASKRVSPRSISKMEIAVRRVACEIRPYCDDIPCFFFIVVWEIH